MSTTKKLSRLLLATTLMVGLGAGMSAQAATVATQTLQCTLAAYVNITPDNSAVTSATIDGDTGALSNPLTSKFNIQLNADQNLYLRASAASSSSTERAFFKNGADTYVVLAHTTNKPTVAAITDAKSATPTAANNSNVIAYKVTGITLTGATTAAPTYDVPTSQYTIAGKAGATAATTTIGTVAEANTYSYNDTAGTYQSIVTLTSSPT